jgi:hypothetical protein
MRTHPKIYYSNKHYEDVKSQNTYLAWSVLWTCEFIYINCHVFLAPLTNNNGFWIGLLNLLTPSIKISFNHNQLQQITANLQPNPSSLTAEGPLHSHSRSRSTRTTGFWVSVRVRITLRLAVYHYSVGLGDRLLETHDQYFWTEYLRS